MLDFSSTNSIVGRTSPFGGGVAGHAAVEAAPEAFGSLLDSLADDAPDRGLAAAPPAVVRQPGPPARPAVMSHDDAPVDAAPAPRKRDAGDRADVSAGARDADRDAAPVTAPADAPAPPADPRPRGAASGEAADGHADAAAADHSASDSSAATPGASRPGADAAAAAAAAFTGGAPAPGATPTGPAPASAGAAAIDAAARAKISGAAAAPESDAAAIAVGAASDESAAAPDSAAGHASGNGDAPSNGAAQLSPTAARLLGAIAAQKITQVQVDEAREPFAKALKVATESLTGSASTSERGSAAPAIGQLTVPTAATLARGLASSFELAAAGSPGTNGSVDLGADTAVDQLVQALRLQYSRGGGDAQIRLEPSHFGDLSVSLRVDDGSVAAKLVAASPLVREWLHANENLLRQSLAEQGLKLDRLEIAEPPSEPRHDGRETRQDRPRDGRPLRRQRPTDTGEHFEVVA